MSDSVSEVNSSKSAAVPTKISSNWESWSLVSPPAAGSNHFPKISKMSRIWCKASIQSLAHTVDSGMSWIEYGNEEHKVFYRLYLWLVGHLLNIRSICNISWSHPVKQRRGKCSRITNWKASFKQFSILGHTLILRGSWEGWYHSHICPF